MTAAFPFPITVQNFVTYFGFQILMSGTSEEVLFRSLVMVPLLLVGERGSMSSKTITIVVSSIATIIFMLAHINFTLFPFRITYFNPLQQLTVLIFGYFYAYLFIKTRSIIGPIVAHNLLNGVITVIGLMLFLFIR
ncbi:MAG: CPBP family intramembrane glutamic endopeptidase [Termitinemataceae bacterium]